MQMNGIEAASPERQGARSPIPASGQNLERTGHCRNFATVLRQAV
jgi:hypothetical protein